MFYLQQQKSDGKPLAPSTIVVVAPPPKAVVPAIDAGVAVAVVEPPDAGVTEVAVVVPPPPKPPKKVIHVAEAPVQPSGPPGFITIDANPYAVIFIDGKKYGETPLVHISVPPGKHSVRAVSGSGGTRNFSIQIESGKTAPVRRIEW
jgi:hypothetical protein